MADFNDERTVIVDRDTRDTADRSSPVGWIILLAVLLLLALFFLFGGGSQWFNGNTNDTGDTNTPIETPTTNPNPTTDTNDFNSDTEPTLEPNTEEPTPVPAE